MVGIHVVTDTWEVAGLRCEAPEGMSWEIVGVEPRLLFGEDELFLDQLYSGTRIFIEVELIGNGSGVEFSLSGTVKGVPSGCLLYTSPSPRDGLLSRMPSSA